MASRAQTLYWNELTDLKAGCEYVRLYRDSLGATLTRLAVARSVVGVAALGGWITIHIDPHIWAAVIVSVQVADALQRAIPWAARFTGTNELCAAFDALLIEAQLEWECIAAAEWEEEKIRKRWARLAELRRVADKKALPHGLPQKPKLERLAKATATAYFQALYPEEA
jgi:hypothetical protein